MDDIKLYGHMQQLLCLTEIFPRDMDMSLRLNIFKMMSVSQGNLETKVFVMESGDVIEPMWEKLLQALQIRHKNVKQSWLYTKRD
jgi:hypothetical protein